MILHSQVLYQNIFRMDLSIIFYYATTVIHEALCPTLLLFLPIIPCPERETNQSKIVGQGVYFQTDVEVV